MRDVLVYSSLYSYKILKYDSNCKWLEWEALIKTNDFYTAVTSFDLNHFLLEHQMVYANDHTRFYAFVSFQMVLETKISIWGYPQLFIGTYSADFYHCGAIGQIITAKIMNVLVWHAKTWSAIAENCDKIRALYWKKSTAFIQNVDYHIQNYKKKL